MSAARRKESSLDELVKLIDNLHIPNTPGEIQASVLAKDGGRKQMEAVARVRGAAAGVQAPAAESPRPLKRLGTKTSPGSCDFKPPAKIARTDSPRCSPRKAADTGPKSGRPATAGDVRNAPGLLPLKRSLEEDKDERETPEICAAASVPQPRAVSSDAADAGADSGEPTRTGGFRDAPPGQLPLKRSLEENQDKSETAAAAAEARLRTHLSRGLGEEAAKKAAEKTQDGSGLVASSAASGSNDTFGVTKRDHLRRQLEKSRAHSNTNSTSAASSSAQRAGTGSERSAAEDVVIVPETQADGWKMNVPNSFLFPAGVKDTKPRRL